MFQGRRWKLGPYVGTHEFSGVFFCVVNLYRSPTRKGNPYSSPPCPHGFNLKLLHILLLSLCGRAWQA